MDFPDAPPHKVDPQWRRAAVAVALLALVLYGSFLCRNVAAVAGASDSSGYFNHARLLASGHLRMEARTVPGFPPTSAPPKLYMALGFRPAWNGKGLVPTYPAGLPLLILAAEPLAGWKHAGDLVLVLHSLAGLVVVFALGRRLGLGEPWAALGAVVVALSPLYLFMSLVAMSDVPSLVWTTLAILAALRSRERPLWALAAGAAIALDVLLRPTNILAFIPAAIALGSSPRRWLLFALGGLPGAVFFCAHSMAAYGSLATTGYGDSTREFSLALVPGALAHYAHWLPLLFTPVVALNLALPFLGGESARTRWLLATWILAYAAFYSTYRYTQEVWWYLRFLLPAVPAMVVGGLLVLRALLRRVPRWANPGRSPAAFVVALSLAAAALDHQTKLLHPFSVGAEERVYSKVTDWMVKNLPPDSICLTMQASGALVYSTSFTFVRWDALDSGNVGKVDAAIRASGRPLYAVLFPFEVTDQGVLDKKMPGHWTQVGKVEEVTLWRRDFGSSRN